MPDLPLNEYGTHQFTELIASIYKAVGEPLPHGEGMRDGLNNYTDEEGKTHLSKMLRLGIAAQRLNSLLDRVKEAVFTHLYLDKEFELTNEKAERPFLEQYLSRNLVGLDIQIVSGITNFLSYYFDLESKDDQTDLNAFRNYLFIYDPRLCLEIEGQLLNSEALQTLRSIFTATANDYAGLTTMDRDWNTGNMRLNAIAPYPIEEIKKCSIELIRSAYSFLQFSKEHISKKYSASKGFDSPQDFAVDVEPHGGYYRPAKHEGIENAKRNAPIRIFNLTSEIPARIETDYFTLHRNHTFEELKDLFHRSSTKEQTTINLTSGKPAKVERMKLPPQEGELLWTHTVLLKEPALDLPSRFLIDSDFIEDICLLLCLLTGSGAYTEKASLRYSHKAHAVTRLLNMEQSSALNQALTKYSKLSEQESQVYGLALAKYREAIQPMSTNITLIRLWEVIDLLADYFCKDKLKEIPKEYIGKETQLREFIKERLKIAEEGTPLDLISDSGFTPIFLEKSVSQKVLQLIEVLNICELLDVAPSGMKKRIRKACELRSKFIHSATPFTGDKEKDLIFVEYYFFTEELLYLIFLQIFEIEAEETRKKIGIDIKGFIQNTHYFKEKSDLLKSKSNEFEEFLQYFSGEKEPPPGEEIRFSL